MSKEMKTPNDDANTPETAQDTGKAKRLTIAEKLALMLSSDVVLSKTFVYTIKTEGCKIELHSGILHVKLCEKSDQTEIPSNSPFNYAIDTTKNSDVKKTVIKFFHVYEMIS